MTIKGWSLFILMAFVLLIVADFQKQEKVDSKFISSRKKLDSYER